MRRKDTNFDYNSAVVANKVGGDQPTYIFRSYPHDPAEEGIKNPGPADPHEIWKVARATSAAPTFFDPITIDNVDYSDGGVGSNNPVDLLVDEVISKSGLTGSLRLPRAFDVLISIGTGQAPSKIDKAMLKKEKQKLKHPSIGGWISKRTLYRHIAEIIDSLRNEATNVDKPHENIKNRAKETDFKGYYRWTGGEPVGGLKLDEWHAKSKGNLPTTAKFIEDEVRIYMAQAAIVEEVKAAARKLVDRRRARFMDPNRTKYGNTYRGRFGRYTYCSLLRCPYCTIPTKTHVETEDALVDHISSQHPHIKCDLYKTVRDFAHIPPRLLGGPY